MDTHQIDDKEYKRKYYRDYYRKNREKRRKYFRDYYKKNKRKKRNIPKDEILEPVKSAEIGLYNKQY